MPNPNAIDDFAARYANAWSSQKPAAVAAFFAANGSLRINDGPAAVGRFAIADLARSLMTAFPDWQVFCDHVTRAVTAWSFTGRSTVTTAVPAVQVIACASADLKNGDGTTTA